MTFTIRQGIDLAPLKQVTVAIANAKILLPLRRAIVGFVTIGFFHAEDGSLETEQVKQHRQKKQHNLLTQIKIIFKGSINLY